MLYDDRQAYGEFFRREGEVIAVNYCPLVMCDALFFRSRVNIRMPVPHRVYVKCRVVDEPSHIIDSVSWSVSDKQFNRSPNLNYFIEDKLSDIDKVMKGKGLEISILSEIDSGYGFGASSYILGCIGYFLYKHKYIEDYFEFFTGCNFQQNKWSFIEQIVCTMRRTTSHTNFTIMSRLTQEEIFNVKDIFNAEKKYFPDIEFYTDRDCNISLYDLFDVSIVIDGNPSGPMEIINRNHQSRKARKDEEEEMGMSLAAAGEIVKRLVESDVSESVGARDRIVAELISAMTDDMIQADKIFQALYKMNRIFNVEDGLDKKMRKLRAELGPDALLFHNRAKNKLIIISRLNTTRKQIEQLDCGVNIFNSWQEYQPCMEMGEYKGGMDNQKYCIMSEVGTKFYENKDEAVGADITFEVEAGKAYIFEDRVKSDKMPSVKFTIEVLKEVSRKGAVNARELPKSSYSLSRHTFMSKIARPLQRLTGIELITTGTDQDFEIGIRYNGKNIALIR